MEIAFLLQKYAKLGYSQKRTKEVILEVLTQEFSFEIDGSDIEIKDTEVKLKVSGSRRTHFVLHKSKIEEMIQERLKKENIIVTQIR